MKNNNTYKNKLFCVLGLSTFGTRTAINLCESGAQVLAIDKDGEKINGIADKVTRAIQADVLDDEVMKSIGISDIDIAIIGMKYSFDVSVLLVQYLKESGIKEIVAQVDSNAKAVVLKKLGATTIVFPERDIAEKVSKSLLVPSIVDHIPIGSEAAVIEIKCPQKFVGKSLIELEIRKKFGVSIIGIKSKVGNKPETANIAPAPNDVFHSGDIMLVLGPTKCLDRFTAEIEEK